MPFGTLLLTLSAGTLWSQSAVDLYKRGLENFRTGDLDAARAFVAAQLGDLARDDAKERDERAALLAVLDAQGSFATAARDLGIHRNTVLQRVRRAEARRGRPATINIAELHAALVVCDVLGASVLRESSPH